jgi:hypothetical protein
VNAINTKEAKMRTVTGDTLERKFHSLFVKMGFACVEATEQARLALEYVREHGAVTLMDNGKAVTFTKA